MDEVDGLRLADAAIARDVVVPVASTDEKTFLREFCLLNIKKRDLTSSTEDKKLLRDRIKRAKDTLQQFMSKNAVSCMALSKEQYAAVEKSTGEADVPMMPMYVRLLRSNKDSAITQDILVEAIDSVTPELVKECGSTKAAILQNVRTAIRSYSYSIKMSDSKERNQHVYEITDVPEDLVAVLLDMHVATTKMSTLSSEHKEAVSEITGDINRLKASVSRYFEKAGVVTQRVVLDGNPYRITRKVSVRREKLGLIKLESMLDALDLSNLVKAKERIVATIENTPPTTKSDIVFCAVRKAST